MSEVTVESPRPVLTHLYRVPANPESLPKSPALVANLARGMSVIVMPRGPLRYVNVAARLLKHNLEPERALKIDEHVAVSCVRVAANPGVVLVFDEIEILGPCRIAYTPHAPLANTGGRGIAYMQTTATIRGYLRAGQLLPKQEHELP